MGASTSCSSVPICGQPGQLAYKLDSIIINRRIDEVRAERGLIPELIRLGSLYEIAQELGLNRDTNSVRKALRQNSGASIDAKIRFTTTDGHERTLEFEEELKRRRRDHVILRVDRSDLSKNVLRGFAAFDQFLEQHPEFLERVTFIAQLMPSRMDVEQYRDYLERIEHLVALVNHKHGTPDWMPIQLKLRDDLEEAVAAYKNYDLMIVNAMFDGMNLVAKEGPLVNERNGVSILSENTGAHEELGEFALSVNPFDIGETADSIHRALTMGAEERERRWRGLRDAVTARDPGDWIDEQLDDIREKRASGASALG